MSVTIVKPELLAPVGSPEALIAAVRCGADAVYLGAGRFHARQHSQPFDEAALRQAVAYCHARGVAVHLTLNTLVHEDEMEQALADAARAAELGVDALIVQDRGLAAAIHRAAPTLTLHASTQLSCHTPEGVKQLQREGFSRVVLAREMTEKEICDCTGLGCETEVFVHGALCMSVSGQCLLSAMLGGRSGNRGCCAQPCRLPFSLKGLPGDNDRALSLKDNSLTAHVQTLAAMGVRSLKIEGRMKRPEYVAAAVSVCRAALDGRDVDSELLGDLKSIFSRSGFTDGYFTDRRTMAMFGSRTKEDVTAAPAAVKRLGGLYRKEHPCVALEMVLTVKEKVPLTLTVTDTDGHTVSAVGDLPRQSQTPLPSERLKSALQKLGGTPFYAQTIRLIRDDAADVPLSAANALRREATERLLSLREQTTSVPFSLTVSSYDPPAPRPSVPALVVRLASVDQWSQEIAEKAALVVLPPETPAERLQACCQAGPVAVEIPRGLFSQESRVRKELATAVKMGVSAAVCHQVGALPLAREAGLAIVGGFGLHTTNYETLQCHVREGLCAATLSPELSWKQARFAALSPLPTGVIAYGRLPLMLLRNCPAKAAFSCAACGQDRRLTDRKGVSFPLMCTHGCADLLNSVVLYTADKWRDLPPVAFVTLYMTDESAQRVKQITAAYAEAPNGGAPAAGTLCPDGFTRGMKGETKV